ncbi:putative lipid phosphate phosphatase beta [Silene latifolia]|uniref:putative lipid phosphate phosphatase beta n=1 Tax=Silene latifolia TaxID=37657 RepID=UPI003D76F910
MSNRTTEPPNPPTQPNHRTLLNHLTNLDKSLTTTLHTLTKPLIPPILLKLLELTGDGRLWFPLILSLLYSRLRFRLRHQSLLLPLLVGLVTDIAAVGLIKYLVRRPRPAHNSHPMGPTLSVDRFSFPSGHASRVCFIAAFVDLCGEEGLGGPWIGWVWVWALTTAVSRVLFGRHYVFDVVVGSGVGVVNAYFVYRFFRF